MPLNDDDVEQTAPPGESGRLAGLAKAWSQGVETGAAERDRLAAALRDMLLEFPYLNETTRRAREVLNDPPALVERTVCPQCAEGILHSFAHGYLCDSIDCQSFYVRATKPVVE